MKINTNEAVYVQRKDFVFLIDANLPLSTSIFVKSHNKDLTTLTEENKYDFIKMNGKYDRNFFDNLEWILDYDYIKSISEIEILKQISETTKELEKLISEYTSFNELEKINNKDILRQIKILKYKIDSLKECILFKKEAKDIEKQKIIKLSRVI